MKGLSRQVRIATLGAIAIFAVFEVIKTVLFPHITIIASHVMTVIVAGVLTFFVTRYALSRHNAALADRERQTKIIEETNRLFSAVLSSTQEGVLIVNSDAEVVLHNETATKIFRPSAARPIRLAELIRNPSVNDCFRRSLESKVTLEERVEIPGRQVRVYRVFTSPLGDDLALGVFFDITELERLEAVRREFFANLSHELRTPLTAILACSETLMNGAIDDPENRVHFVARLHKHALRMNELILDILDLSAIESGVVKLETAPVCLLEVATEVVGLLEARSSNRSVRITLSIPDDLFVMADRKRLGQILHNLVDNAVKFNTQAGSVRITARVEKETVMTEVEDTGPGMPREDLPRVFERLYRGDKSRSRTAVGFGLGLAIVKHLVQAQGGEVSVTSEIGQGSTFRFTLPLAVTSQAVVST